MSAEGFLTACVVVLLSFFVIDILTASLCFADQFMTSESWSEDK